MNKDEIACKFCGKMNKFMNFCDWKCHVEHAKKEGAVLHTPNNLPQPNRS